MLREAIEKFRGSHLVCDLGEIDNCDLDDEISYIHFGRPPMPLKIKFRISGLDSNFVMLVAVDDTCDDMNILWAQETKDCYRVGPLRASVSSEGQIDIEARPSFQYLAQIDDLLSFLLPVHLAFQREDQWKLTSKPAIN